MDSQETGVESYIARGGLLLGQGDVSRAQEQFELALGRDPENLEALSLLGLCFFKRSAFDEALPIYKDLVEKSPNDPSIRLNLGLLYLKLGKGDKALAEFQASQQLDPEQPQLQMYTGLALARTGNLKEAYRTFLDCEQTALAEEIAQKLPPEVAAEIREEKTSGLAEGSVAKPVQSRLSEAVQLAAPSAEAEQGLFKLGTLPLSVFAAENEIRFADQPFTFVRTPAGHLSVRIDGAVHCRTNGLQVSSGAIDYNPTGRRQHGQPNETPFDERGTMYTVSGQGGFVLAPGAYPFVVLQLDDNSLYIRPEFVTGYDSNLFWENGSLPGTNQGVALVQYRGTGQVVLALPPHYKVQVAEHSLYCEPNRLLGWTGDVIPRQMTDEQNVTFVECQGQGTVLLSEDV